MRISPVCQIEISWFNEEVLPRVRTSRIFMHAPRGSDVSRSLVAMVGEGEDNLARCSSVSFESYATLVELIICTLAQG